MAQLTINRCKKCTRVLPAGTTVCPKCHTEHSIVPEVVKPARPTASRTKSKSRGKAVTVRSGDTLSHIARRNHTTVAKLRKLNGIKGSNLRPGQKIRVK